ncbi:glycosyltransferase family 9 protein [Conservatibacter flavescens]|uniref:ADP-heptose--LPS heptosyltransferase I n=1 Tax=Conservatibacter flavescens TaxID=28161 RepID=A0A2M8S3G9_9PAST|nr:glycosyltransferase family 9 protein [Conservatibacter flavescens]PJG85691.1 ADP-heptose--LPS heptosyltransferase I [Conservatibacter flavescens]
MPLFDHAPKSLCILRLSAIGDVCHVVAAVQQIQAYWKETQITWIIGKTEAQLLSGLAGVNFVVYDKKSGWKGVLAVWKQLKHQRFDALLNMQTAFRASILSLGIRAKYKIGFSAKRAREGQWLFTNRKTPEPQNPHVLDGFMAFAAYLGVPISAPHWHMPIDDIHRQAVQQYIDPNRKNVLIAPCSSKAEKDWLPERYAQVANWAYQHNINVILSASTAPREQKIIEKITALCEFDPVNLAGKTSLKELTALIGMVDLVISPDSAAAHIATSQNTPVIGLYAYHNPLRTGPYNNLTDVISVYEQNAIKEFGQPSSKLAWATKLKGKNLMSEISVNDVITHMQKWLS